MIDPYRPPRKPVRWPFYLFGVVVVLFAWTSIIRCVGSGPGPEATPAPLATVVPVETVAPATPTVTATPAPAHGSTATPVPPVPTLGAYGSGGLLDGLSGER